MILLHGLGATNVSMATLIAELARTHRVIAPDLPGFGESGKPLRPLHAAYYARWLAQFLDALGVERATVIGNSMGGRIALELGLRSPDRTDKLVLLAPSMAWRSFRQFVPLVHLLRPEMAALPLLVPRVQVLTRCACCSRGPIASCRPGSTPRPTSFFTCSRRRAVASASSTRRGRFTSNRAREHGFWERLRRLRAPALFVWGDGDRLVPTAFARHTVDAVPHATSVVLDDCGHVPQYEAMDRVAELLRSFLPVINAQSRMPAADAAHALDDLEVLGVEAVIVEQLVER